VKFQNWIKPAQNIKTHNAEIPYYMLPTYTYVYVGIFTYT
jgi:hypothetical protein